MESISKYRHWIFTIFLLPIMTYHGGCQILRWHKLKILEFKCRTPNRTINDCLGTNVALQIEPTLTHRNDECVHFKIQMLAPKLLIWIQMQHPIYTKSSCSNDTYTIIKTHHTGPSGSHVWKMFGVNLNTRSYSYIHLKHRSIEWNATYWLDICSHDVDM